MEQKVKIAVDMVEHEDDGATYLAKNCGIKEIKSAIDNSKKEVLPILQDALVIKRWMIYGK